MLSFIISTLIRVFRSLTSNVCVPQLARCLAEARKDGRADPTLLDDFNKQSAERSFQGDAAEDPDFEAAAEAVASDGGLPGGMSPDMLQKLMQDPELMALLRNPKMQDVMKKVMTGGPEAAAEFMGDPEVMEMLKKVSSATSGVK